jgi:hypothetical protein
MLEVASVAGPVSGCRSDSHSGMPAIAAENSTMTGMLAQNQLTFAPQVVEALRLIRRVSHGLLTRLSPG